MNSSPSPRALHYRTNPVLLALLLGAPSVAYADHEEVLFAILGWLVGLVVACAIAWYISKQWWRRCLVVISAVAVVVASGYVPLPSMSETENFLCGFLPPIVVAGITGFLFHQRR